MINKCIVWRKQCLFLNFNVNERSIQRDIEDIRNFIDKEGAETGEINNVIYDREKKGYGYNFFLTLWNLNYAYDKAQNKAR